MENRNNKALAAVLGASFLGLAATASAGENPFAQTELSEGYQVAEHHEGGEGKCGEAKCGEMEEPKDGEGSCGH